MPRKITEVLRVSEMFTSIQGEGLSAGCPAFFLRLKGCGFNCSWCDTTAVWKLGAPVTLPNLTDSMLKQGVFDLFQRDGHFIITGGDPLLQQPALVALFNYWQGRNLIFNGKLDGLITEVETQGNTKPLKAFSRFVSHWNVSPKLESSGVKVTKRICPDVLAWFNSIPNSTFKFPVQGRNDLEEVFALVCKQKLKHSKVMLMPVCHHAASFATRSQWLVKECVRYGLRFSPRLQVAIWDKTTGV